MPAPRALACPRAPAARARARPSAACVPAACRRPAQTKMSGFFQTVFYFGYMFLFCFGLAMMCGAIGYLGCSLFVKRIYKNIKSD